MAQQAVHNSEGDEQKKQLYLASVSSVDHRDSLVPSQRVDVDLVGISTAVALLLGLGELRQQQLLALLWQREHRGRCERPPLAYSSNKTAETLI